MIQQFKYLVITVFYIILSINNCFSQAISVGFVSVMTTDQKSIQISVIKTDEINASKFKIGDNDFIIKKENIQIPSYIELNSFTPKTIRIKTDAKADTKII